MICWCMDLIQFILWRFFWLLNPIPLHDYTVNAVCSEFSLGDIRSTHCGSAHSNRCSLGLCLRGRLRVYIFMLLQLGITSLWGLRGFASEMHSKFPPHPQFMKWNTKRLAFAFVTSTLAVRKHPEKGDFREKGLQFGLQFEGAVHHGVGGKQILYSTHFLLFMQFRTQVLLSRWISCPISSHLKKIILHRHTYVNGRHVCCFIPQHLAASVFIKHFLWLCNFLP